MAGGNAARQPAVLGDEDVLQAVHKEFLQVANIGDDIAPLPHRQLSRQRPFYCGVQLRGTHPKLHCEPRVSPGLLPPDNELEYNQHILWF